MQNQEWIEMFRVLPPEMHNQVVIVLLNGSELTIDTFCRFEANFLLARGRVGGTLDENRPFFIPYDQMLYCRLERSMKVEELEDMFVNRPNSATAATEAVRPAAPTPAALPVVPSKADSTATRTALLERIRAARASQSTADGPKSHFG
jgi:hypothetical protein